MTSAYAIKAEIADWSQEVLEVSCDAYGGLPPCPFARRAWIDGLVTVEVVDNIAEVIADACLADADSEFVMVYALIDSGGLTVKQFDAYIEELNAIGNGVWGMGAHHESSGDDLMPEFESKTGVDYGLILVQSLEHLVVASDKLRNTSYYDRFNEQDMAYIDRRKEKVICVE